MEQKETAKLEIEFLRKIDPDTVNLTDEELEQLRAGLYDLAQLAYEDWLSNAVSNSRLVINN